MADPAGGPPLLEVDGVSKTFGGIAAVSEVSISVRPGESVGLVGPNGAGKTTLFNCVGGQLRPERGRVELEGVDLLDLPTYKRARLGIGRTYQRIEVFPDMTVWDHLLVAVRARWCTGRIFKDLSGGAARPPKSAGGWTRSSSWSGSPTRPTPWWRRSDWGRAGWWSWPGPWSASRCC